MTNEELLRRAREALPRESADATSLLEWRGRICSIRHTLPDGSRAGEVADALIGMVGSSVRLLTEDADPRVELQEHLWRFCRLKGNTTDEATAAAEEIERRIAGADDSHRRPLLAQLYCAIMGEEFRLLEASMRSPREI